MTTSSSSYYPPLDVAPAAGVLQQLTCAACAKSLEALVTPRAMFKCGHFVHSECHETLLRKHDNALTDVGGVGDGCRVCSLRAPSTTAAATAAANPRLAHKVCLEEMRTAYRARFPALDLEAIAARQPPSDNDIRALLGPLDHADVAGARHTLRQLLSGLRDDEKEVLEADLGADALQAKRDEREVNRRRLLALRGNELVDELVARGRTIDARIGNGRDDGDCPVTVAHLHQAGIDQFEQLQRLGFEVGRHTAAEYHRLFPVYYLVAHFGLDHYRYLTEMSNAQLAAMALTKQEFRLLGIDADTLVGERSISSSFVLGLPMRPSALNEYLGLSHEQLLALQPPLTTQHFSERPLWWNDRDTNDFSKRLHSAVKKREKRK